MPKLTLVTEPYGGPAYNQLCQALFRLERATPNAVEPALRYASVAAGEWLDTFPDRAERRCRAAEVGYFLAQAYAQAVHAEAA